MAHNLFIDINDGVNDNRFINVKDLSVYDDVIGINQRILQVLPPFSDEYVRLPFPRYQETSFSTDHLKLTCNGNIHDLPDGLYKFHFSIAPNNKVFIVHHHYRTANLLNQVFAKMALVSLDCNKFTDECGNIEINKYQNILLHIWMLLNGCQAVAKNEFQAEKAKALYDQARSTFNSLYNIENCKMC